MSLHNNISVSFRKSSTDSHIAAFYTFFILLEFIEKGKKQMSHVKLWLEFSLLSWFVCLWQS